jgi:subtilisin-like proprotein convertase family protein
MKPMGIIFMLVLAATLSVRADNYLFTATGLPATIPDNNGTGLQNSLTINGVSGPLEALTVTLNIAGGYNGDLYMALDYNNASAVLLNRAGLSAVNDVGYQNSGFNITLDDRAASDVHFYQSVSFALNAGGQLTGTWQPDGRSISPLSSGGVIASAPRGNRLGLFDGMDPNGTWTLFAADLSPGGVSTLLGWSLNITVVPEPGIGSLICGGAFGLLLRRRRHG